MANSGRYALKTLAMDSTSRRRTEAPGLVITAVSAKTSAASSTNTASGKAGSAGACTIVAPHDRNVSSYTACSAPALARSMGSRAKWVSWHSTIVGLTARVTATSMLLGQRHPRARGQMLHQVPGEQREDVQRRPTALADAMRAIGIRHEVEWLAELDQAVHQAFCALVMHVVIAEAVHDQQAPLQSLGLIDRRRTVVARAVRGRVQETHIALLVNRVVEALVRHRGYGHPDLVDVGVTKHRLQRARSAAAPAPDRDARGVEIVARSREGT